MPPREYWETLVEPEGTLDRLGLLPGCGARVVELGCGYGTFTVPAARRAAELLTFDLDPAMVELTRARAQEAGLGNVAGAVRDVVSEGYGLEPSSCDAVLLLNILHCEGPVAMLSQAAGLLRPGGRVLATHWRYDPRTPRGPPMHMRPRPEQLEEWAACTGRLRTERGPVDCPPWHYGWAFSRL